MKKWLPIALACAAVAGVAIWLTLFRSSDEDRVKKTLADLATIVSVKDGDTIISRTVRLRSRLKEVVSDDVSVRVDELGMDVRGRQRLEDDAAKAGLVFQNADCTFVTTKMQIDPAATIAQVDATALVTANRGGERKVDKRDVHFLLRKDDGTWKVSTIDVATLRRDD